MSFDQDPRDDPILVQLDECIAEVKRLQKQLADLQEVVDDKQRLVRELDVAMHGDEGAAKQASLCDLVGPARDLRAKAARWEAIRPYIRARQDGWTHWFELDQIPRRGRNPEVEEFADWLVALARSKAAAARS